MSTKQYMISFTSEFTIDTANELGIFMSIPIDEKLINEVCLWEARCNVHARDFAAFYDPQNRDNLIFVCCSKTDILDSIIVRCNEIQAEKIKTEMLEIDARIRSIAHQAINHDLDDLTYDPINGLQYYNEKYGTIF